MMDGTRTGKETDLAFWEESAQAKREQGINKQKPLLIAVLQERRKEEWPMPRGAC